MVDRISLIISIGETVSNIFPFAVNSTDLQRHDLSCIETARVASTRVAGRMPVPYPGKNRFFELIFNDRPFRFFVNQNRASNHYSQKAQLFLKKPNTRLLAWVRILLLQEDA